MSNLSFDRRFQPVRALVCLLVAALFWLLNALNQDRYALNVEYPVRFLYNDSLYVSMLPLPRTVTANVSGTGWHLLGQSLIPYRTRTLDYSIANPLRVSTLNTTALRADLAEHIKNLRVNYIVADTLELSFDKRIRKTVRVVPDSLHIDLAPRFVVTSRINLTPDSITIEGPRRLVQGLPGRLVVRVPGKRIAANYDEELVVNNFRHPQLRTSDTRIFISFEVGELLSPLPVWPPSALTNPAAATKPNPFRVNRQRR